MTYYIECLCVDLVDSPACVVACDWDDGRSDESDIQGGSVIYHCGIAEACSCVQ